MIQQAQSNANNYHVIAGIARGSAMVSRFYPSSINIHAGETVNFKNEDMGPHTVSFGSLTSGQEQTPVGNPLNFDGNSPLNSGLLIGTNLSYQVRFIKAGIYKIYCAIHDYYGMVMSVHVS